MKLLGNLGFNTSGNTVHFGLTEFKGPSYEFFNLFKDFKTMMAGEEAVLDSVIKVDEYDYRDRATMKVIGPQESYLTGRLRTFLVDRKVREPLEVSSDQVGDEFIRHFETYPYESRPNSDWD